MPLKIYVNKPHRFKDLIKIDEVPLSFQKRNPQRCCGFCVLSDRSKQSLQSIIQISKTIYRATRL